MCSIGAGAGQDSAADDAALRAGVFGRNLDRQLVAGQTMLGKRADRAAERLVPKRRPDRSKTLDEIPAREAPAGNPGRDRPVAFLQVCDVFPDVGDHTDALVAEHAGTTLLGNLGQFVNLRGTDAGGRLLDDDLIGARIRNIDFVDKQRLAGSGHNGGS